MKAKELRKILGKSRVTKKDWEKYDKKEETQ